MSLRGWTDCQMGDKGWIERFQPFIPTLEPRGAGAPCPEQKRERCATPVPDQNCTGTYSEWTDCINDQKTRFFTRLTLQSGDGIECPEDILQACTSASDCVGQWQNWGPCQQATKTRKRQFVVQVPHAGDGQPCVDDAEAKGFEEFEDCTMPVSAQDCVGKWSKWSACENGEQQSNFVVQLPPILDGNACPESPKFRDCVIPSVDCIGSWSEWSACDGTRQKRSFTVQLRNSGAGEVCPDPEEAKACTLLIPDLDCKGIWSSWSACD